MARFRVWAPHVRTLRVVVGNGEPHPMMRRTDGWWEADVLTTEHPVDYAFLVDDDPTELPDPRSAQQPHGVHGRSRLVDHASFEWHDTTWRGLPLAGSVLYELHVGTFTAEGTFDAAIEKLDSLVELGIDAVELLPVAAFEGPRGWGYDGVALFAVHEPYGGPEGLKRFVDAAHARGLGVVLDVVYNHLGPSGNYLGRFGPYFTTKHSTPWGAAVNLDDAESDEVRRFVLDNALQWLRDYHIDGLRLDAVHALADDRATHLLEELAVAVDSLGAQLRKPLFLIAESDLNDPTLITPREAGGYGLTGQWCDDVHHALHSALTGETQGYYLDFGSLQVLAQAMTNAFVHAGSFSTFRGRRHGRPVDRERTQPFRFVTYLSNHDQIGNRAVGDRLASNLSTGRLHIAAALLLTSPFTPMLFMGEEWGARTPWQFFTSFEGAELADSVRTGRRAEFADHGWDANDVPDPQDPATFERSKLDWAERDKDDAKLLLDWHGKLLALRRAVPELTEQRLDAVEALADDDAQWFVLRRRSGRQAGDVLTVCNFASQRQTVPVPGTPVELLLASAPGFTYAAGVIELDAESVAVLRVLPE